MESDALVPYLIEITNEDLGVFRYTNLDSAVEYDGKVFSPAYFELSPPEKTEGAIGNAKISISAVNQEWIARIRSTQRRSTLRLVHCVVYTERGEVRVEGIEDTMFTLTNADWDDAAISWEMEFDDVMQIDIPCDVADSLNMAGCT